MLEVGISSTVHSANSWSMLGKRRGPVREARLTSLPAHADAFATSPYAMGIPASGHRKGRIGEVIEDALRKAGLMK